MRKTWRWFGPVDRVSVRDAHQAGAEGLVSALHHIPTGAVWSVDEIRKRQDDCLSGGLAWELVESIPVSEAIKCGGAEARAHIEAWKLTLENLAECGIKTVCYNFMPVLDWTRTDLRSERPNGARAMRFDLVDFATFDLFILQREGARDDYGGDILDACERRLGELDDTARVSLAANVTAGLPGAAAGYSLDDLRRHLASYRTIGRDRLRTRLVDFLSEVVPTAERYDMKLSCHPDDPPWPLLGLPRIMSTEADYRAPSTGRQTE